jgi:hypothetical protein
MGAVQLVGDLEVKYTMSCGKKARMCQHVPTKIRISSYHTPAALLLILPAGVVLKQTFLYLGNFPGF